MNSRARLAIIASVAAVPLALAAPASAHVIDVTTPSGQQNTQFLGGPGNPGHAGHHGGPSGQGHLAACAAAEGNSGAGVVNFINTLFGSCQFN